MSVVIGTVPFMFHPWRRLASMPRIDVVWAALPGDHLGMTDGSTIWLDNRQLQVERRCTLAHELAHVELGHIDGCTGREEEQAARLAARQLIRIEHLGDALVWSEHVHDVAEALWVDADTLTTRLAHLHPAERHYLTQRLAAKDAPC